MKKTRQLHSTLIAATLCVAAAGWTASGQSVPEPTSPTPTSPTQTEQQQQPESIVAPAQPRSVNRCSQLIGTTVQDPRGQKLGRIQDVVINYGNGQVSYCVMSVEQGPDHLAVPLAAFRPNADGTCLILNSDRDKLAQARGFDPNAWPTLAVPAWGAQAEEQPAAEATQPLEQVTVVAAPGEDEVIARQEQREVSSEAMTPDFGAVTPAWGSPPVWQTTAGETKIMHDQVMYPSISSH